MKDRDKEPIIIENDYFFRLTISNKITGVLIFLSFVLLNLTPELDPHKEMMRRASLTLGIFGILFSIFWEIKIAYQEFYNKFFTKFYDDKISFDHIDEHMKFKTEILQKDDLVSVTWALTPYNEEGAGIWMKDIKNKSDKIIAYLTSPLYFLITMLRHFIFLALNGFKFKKYILYRFKSGIIAVPNNKMLSDKDVKFELSSLFGLYTSDLL
nr:hypothetical protein [uncultured Campylobacter sp.]